MADIWHVYIFTDNIWIYCSLLKLSSVSYVLVSGFWDDTGIDNL